MWVLIIVSTILGNGSGPSTQFVTQEFTTQHNCEQAAERIKLIKNATAMCLPK